MTVTRLRAIAAVLPGLISRLNTLEAELPAGRTRDVAEVAELQLLKVHRLLTVEAAALAQHVEDL